MARGGTPKDDKIRATYKTILTMGQFNQNVPRVKSKLPSHDALQQEETFMRSLVRAHQIGPR
eukprot:1037314-Amphidinium_carterae.1